MVKKEAQLTITLQGTGNEYLAVNLKGLHFLNYIY